MLYWIFHSYLIDLLANSPFYCVLVVLAEVHFHYMLSIGHLAGGTYYYRICYSYCGGVIFKLTDAQIIICSLSLLSKKTALVYLGSKASEIAQLSPQEVLVDTWPFHKMKLLYKGVIRNCYYQLHFDMHINELYRSYNYRELPAIVMPSDVSLVKVIIFLESVHPFLSFTLCSQLFKYGKTVS